jgi:hypothetical protein
MIVPLSIKTTVLLSRLDRGGACCRTLTYPTEPKASQMSLAKWRLRPLAGNETLGLPIDWS